MKFLSSFLILSIAVAAQGQEVVPFASQNYLLGGTQNGKWISADVTAKALTGKSRVVPLGLRGGSKIDVLLNNTGEEYGACPENKLIRFEPETEVGFAIGSNAGWNLFPRLPKSISVKNTNYRKIASDFLKTKGIVKSKIVLSQVVEIDLEGDGQKEVLITGNFYEKGLMEDQTAGDYSFAILQKNVEGNTKNTLIDGEFITQPGAYDPPTRRDILAVADLNGDGRIEVVLDVSYYEGNWKQVFEIKEGQLVKVLEASCRV